MKKLLVVVDMQNDFVDGALGTAEAVNIVPAVVEKVTSAAGAGVNIVFTRDTHTENYLDTKEGKLLPVPHCIHGTDGWQIILQLEEYTVGRKIFDKPTFGSLELMNYALAEQFDCIEVIGLCTDICVISNVMLLKAALPEAEIIVDSSCCAGVTPESHEGALAAMGMCHITCK